MSAGIYLPFAIYKKFMRVMYAHARKHDFPRDMKIWERRSHACYEGPVSWVKFIPEMSVSFFARENDAFEVCKNFCTMRGSSGIIVLRPDSLHRRQSRASLLHGGLRRNYVLLYIRDPTRRGQALGFRSYGFRGSQTHLQPNREDPLVFGK